MTKNERALLLFVAKNFLFMSGLLRWMRDERNDKLKLLIDRVEQDNERTERREDGAGTIQAGS